MSAYSQPYDEKGAGSQTVSPDEGGGTGLILRSPTPFPQKNNDSSPLFVIPTNSGIKLARLEPIIAN